MSSCSVSSPDIYDCAAHSFADAAGLTLLTSPVFAVEQRVASGALKGGPDAPTVVDYDRARTFAVASCPGGCANGVQDVHTLLSRTGIRVTDTVGMQTSHGRVCTGTYQAAPPGASTLGRSACAVDGEESSRSVDVAVKIMPLVRDRDWLSLWHAHRSGDRKTLNRMVDAAKRSFRDPANGAFVEIAILQELEAERRRGSGCTGWPRFVGAALACARAGWTGKSSSGGGGGKSPWSMYVGRKAANEHNAATVACADVGVPVVVCVMEKLGHDLHRHVAEHGLAEKGGTGGAVRGRPRDIVPLLGHALAALHVASTRLGLVHNDLHCSNILCRSHGGAEGETPSSALVRADSADVEKSMLLLFPQPQENGGLLLPFPDGAEAVIIDFGRCTLRSDVAAFLMALREASLGGGAESKASEDGGGDARIVSKEVAGFASKWDVHHTGADAALLLSCMLRYWPSLGKEGTPLPPSWDDPCEQALASWIRTAMTCGTHQQPPSGASASAESGDADATTTALGRTVVCIEASLRASGKGQSKRGDGAVACEHWVMDQLRRRDGLCSGVQPISVLKSELFKRYRVAPRDIEAAKSSAGTVTVVRLPDTLQQ